VNSRIRSPKKGSPLVVKVGSAAVKIYTDENRGSTRYTVAYYDAARRRRREFYTDLPTAKTAANLAATKLQNGEVNVLELSNQDRSNYLHAVELLRPIATRIDVAASEYAEARKVLGASGSVLEAARFYAKHHPTSLPRKKVRTVLDELLAAKRADHKSARYVSDLDNRLEKFASAFDRPIGEITAQEMQEWLVGLNLAPRSRNNFRNNIILLFNFARTRGYLVKNQPTEAESLTKAKAGESDIEIFTPEQMAKLLSHADESLVLYIAIGGFAGLRTAEIQRLEWPEVKVEQGVIEVTAKKAKTGSRRLVPIQPNLREWILPFRRHEGPVCWLSTINQKAYDFAKGLGIEWAQNGLRHSYASYRIADAKDAASVALEMGNSPQMLFKHYRELVTPADAKKWWAIMPAPSGKVIAIPA
jgi:integrase